VYSHPRPVIQARLRIDWRAKAEIRASISAIDSRPGQIDLVTARANLLRKWMCESLNPGRTSRRLRCMHPRRRTDQPLHLLRYVPTIDDLAHHVIASASAKESAGLTGPDPAIQQNQIGARGSAVTRALAAWSRWARS
jgi:hypothetical protein